MADVLVLEGTNQVYPSCTHSLHCLTPIRRPSCARCIPVLSYLKNAFCLLGIFIMCILKCVFLYREIGRFRRSCSASVAVQARPFCPVSTGGWHRLSSR